MMSFHKDCSDAQIPYQAATNPYSTVTSRIGETTVQYSWAIMYSNYPVLKKLAPIEEEEEERPSNNQ